jgi:hypothetical protein
VQQLHATLQATTSREQHVLGFGTESGNFCDSSCGSATHHQYPEANFQLAEFDACKMGNEKSTDSLTSPRGTREQAKIDAAVDRFVSEGNKAKLAKNCVF